MLELKLREEFRGKRLKGTTVDFTNQSKTDALEVPAVEFLKITYPSFDLLKTIEATGPGQSRPVVLLGGRGQGKSHLLAALYHLCASPDAGREWLSDWADRLDNSLIGSLKLRTDCCVIAESLHLQRYKHLWDILFKNHPKGEFLLGKWEGMGAKKTDIPSYDLMVEMFTERPTVLILDEFQTWYDGLTNTKQYPWRNWAFNFIQVLSKITQKNPELLVLVVSVRENNSDACVTPSCQGVVYRRCEQEESSLFRKLHQWSYFALLQRAAMLFKGPRRRKPSRSIQKTPSFTMV